MLQSSRLGRKGMCATHASDTATNPSISAQPPCSPTHSGSARGGTSPHPHCVCLLCFFPNAIQMYLHNYTSHTTSKPKKCALQTPLASSHTMCTSPQPEVFKRHITTFLSFSTDFSTILIKCKTFFSVSSQIQTAVSRRKSTFVFIIWLFFHWTSIWNAQNRCSILIRITDIHKHYISFKLDRRVTITKAKTSPSCEIHDRNANLAPKLVYYCQNIYF